MIFCGDNDKIAKLHKVDNISHAYKINVVVVVVGLLSATSIEDTDKLRRPLISWPAIHRHR